MTPFDPIAILDEIQRLVPAYDVSRINLLAGSALYVAARQGVKTITPAIVDLAHADLEPEV